MAKMTRIVLSVPPEALRQIAAVAASRKTSVCEQIRQAIYHELDSTDEAMRTPAPAQSGAAARIVRDFDFGA
jgi:hypothetical protein